MSTRAAIRPIPAAPVQVSPEPGAPDMAGGVFLSPRVIDRRAYTELAGELRELVERSAAERRDLTDTLERFEQTSRDFRVHEQAQNGNIELAARALKTIDERMARVESLLARSEEQGRIFESLEAKAGGLIDAKIEVLESRLEAVQAAAASKTEALEERVRRASRELEERIESIRRDARTIADPAQEALANLCRRATDLLGREPGGAGSPARNSLGDMIERAETLAGEVERVAATLRDGSDRLEASRRVADELAVRQREIERQADELQAGLDHNLGMVRARIAQQQADIEREAEAGAVRLGRQQEAVESAVEAVHTRLVQRQTEIERNIEIVRSRLLQQQAELIGRSQTAVDQAQGMIQAVEARAAATRGEGEATLEELRGAIQQALDAQSATTLGIKVISAAIEQANSTSARLEPWRALLDGPGSTQIPEPIRRLIESVRGELTGELSSIAGALRSAADRAERAGRAIETTPIAEPAIPVATLIAGRVTQPAIPGPARGQRPVDAAD